MSADDLCCLWSGIAVLLVFAWVGRPKKAVA